MWNPGCSPCKQKRAPLRNILLCQTSLLFLTLQHHKGMELSPPPISVLEPDLQGRFIQKNCFPNPVKCQTLHGKLALLYPAHTPSAQSTSHLVLQPVSQALLWTDRQTGRQAEMVTSVGDTLSHQWLWSLAS